MLRAQKQLEIAVFDGSVAHKYFLDAERQQTAFHEAGHAVLHTLWNLPFEKLEVFSAQYPAPQEFSKYAGRIQSNWKRDCPVWAVGWHPEFSPIRGVEHWERLICTFLAGEIAESIYLGYDAPKFVSKYDQNDIQDLCKSLINNSVPYMNSWIMQLRARTLAVLSLPEVWSAVTAVAQALLDRSVLKRSDVWALVSCTHLKTAVNLGRMTSSGTRNWAVTETRLKVRAAVC